MYGVAFDGEPGAGDLFVLEVWQRFRELAMPFGIRSRDRLRRRAGLPAAPGTHSRRACNRAPAPASFCETVAKKPGS